MRCGIGNGIDGNQLLQGGKRNSWKRSIGMKERNVRHLHFELSLTDAD